MITLIPGIGSRFAQAFVVSMNCSQARLALVGALLLAFIGSAVIAGPLGAEPVFPVKVGPTGRYLVDQNGVPFLIAGESPQAMIGNLSEAEAEMFLANRKAYGFNTVLIDLLCATYTGCRDDGSTFDGIVPFTQQLSGTSVPDLTTPNEAYFARVDRILQIAAQYGFLVLLDPAETGSWLSVLQANGVDRSRQFGRYLGQRYANVPHLVWFHGNDYGDTTEANDEVVTAVALGIKEFDTQHLHTVLFNTSFDDPPVLSTDDSRWLPIIDLNAAYSYQATHNVVLRGYTYAPPMPVFLAESGYEFENIAVFGTAPRNLRAQEYWALLSGASGQVYGNRYTWQFAQGWQDQLDTPGAVQMAHLVALFTPRRWWDLVPDQANTVVTAGLGTFGERDYVTAARTVDGALAMAYVPTARTLTVDLSQLSGPVTARWYDPASGTFAMIPGSPLANIGVLNLTTPGLNADGDQDWVLLLEVLGVPDTIRPTIAITAPTGGPTFLTNTSPLTLGGTAADNLGVTDVSWVNSAGGSGTASGTATWTAASIALQPGVNVLVVTARDAAGNPATATLTVTYAAIAPDTVITATPAAVTNSTSASFSFTATEPGSTFECQLDGGAFAACTSPKGYSLFASSTHTFQVRAISPAGNVDPTPASFTWTVDTIAPTVSIKSPTTNPTYSTVSSPLNLGGTASDNQGVTQVSWANDRGGSGTASGTTSWTAAGIVLLNGANVLTVTARDVAGNTATVSLTVTLAPTFTFTDDPLVSGNTIKTVHITELRAAIDSLRTAQGLQAFLWTDTTLVPGFTQARAIHLIDLRTALNEAYAAAFRTPPSYTDPTVATAETVIKAIHLSELRSAARALQP